MNTSAIFIHEDNLDSFYIVFRKLHPKINIRTMPQNYYITGDILDRPTKNKSVYRRVIIPHRYKREAEFVRDITKKA